MKIDFQKIVVGLSLALATFAVVKVNRVSHNGGIAKQVKDTKKRVDGIEVCIGKKYISANCFNLFNKLLLKETLRKYTYLLNKPYDESTIDRTTKYPNKIWIYWNQDIATAPRYVQECIKSIKRNSGNREVIILNKKNVTDYIYIPQHVMLAYKEGNISHMQFSDIVLTCCLYEHGGMYVDATTYFSDYPAEIFEKELCLLMTESFNKENFREYRSYNIIEGSFAYVKSPKNYIFHILRNFCFEYCKDHWQVPYFFWYSFAVLAFEEDLRFQKIIYNHVVNNEYLRFVPVKIFAKYLHKKFDKNKWEEIKTKSKIHKFSNRRCKNILEGSFLDKLIKGELD